VDLIEGRQPVREALRAGRSIDRILIADGARMKGTLDEIVALAASAEIPVVRVARAELDARASTRSHQGVIAEAAPYRARSWREGLMRAHQSGERPLFLALDGIEDPHNVGALLRSAEVFGVHAVLVPKRRAAPISATVAKVAAGALEHLIVDQVPNLERALAACRDEGLWIVSLAGESSQPIDDCDLLGEPIVLVVGAEGAGVSALIRKRSDQVVSIPRKGKISSLNASVAGAIALWETARKRQIA
jgi:23S rRNA (guanosine2251-2'-O)-methyltransferase